MFLDKGGRLSRNQAVTASAASTSNVKVGTNAGKGEPVKVLFTVKTAFAHAGSTLTISLQFSTLTGSGYADKVVSEAIPVASLVAGYEHVLWLPNVHAAYMRAYYTVAGGSFTDGTIDAHVVLGVDTNRTH